MVADARFWTPIDGPERSAKPRFHRPYVTEVIELLGRIVSSGRRDETILPGDETISRFGADIRKRPLVISLTTKTAARRHPERRQSKCEPSVSSSPSPLSRVSHRWPVRRKLVCRASAPLPITARRSPLQPLRPSLLQPVE